MIITVVVYNASGLLGASSYVLYYVQLLHKPVSENISTLLYLGQTS